MIEFTYYLKMEVELISIQTQTVVKPLRPKKIYINYFQSWGFKPMNTLSTSILVLMTAPFHP